MRNRVSRCLPAIPQLQETILSDMLSPLELRLTQQIEQILAHQNARIEELEGRVRMLETERAAMTTMLDCWAMLQTPQGFSQG